MLTYHSQQLFIHAWHQILISAVEITQTKVWTACTLGLDKVLVQVVEALRYKPGGRGFDYR